MWNHVRIWLFSGTPPCLLWLLEVGFLDSTADNERFDTHFEEIAQAIADGIMDTLKDTSEETPVPAHHPLYRVQVGAFYQLQNAVDLEQELKRMGYNTWIVTE